MKMQVSVVLLFLGALLLLLVSSSLPCIAVNSDSARKGDAVLMVAMSRTRNDEEEDDIALVRGIHLCVDHSEVLVPRGAVLRFEGGVETLEIHSDAVLNLESHEGIVQSAKVEPEDGVKLEDKKVRVRVKWTKCSFEEDDSTALQVLFAVGSIASIIVFVAILFDSKSKQFDKYS